MEETNTKTKELQQLEETKEYERITFFKKWSDEKYCLEAVKQNGDALRYVNNQTDEICLEAIKQNKDALQYVKLPSAFEKITGLKLEEK